MRATSGYYFLFTLTGYGGELKPHAPSSTEAIATIWRLAEHVEPERIIWRIVAHRLHNSPRVADGNPGRVEVCYYDR
jgi:hypothetical protein